LEQISGRRIHEYEGGTFERGVRGTHEGGIRECAGGKVSQKGSLWNTYLGDGYTDMREEHSKWEYLEQISGRWIHEYEGGTGKRGVFGKDI